MQITQSESALNILVLGGKEELIARVLNSDWARKDGNKRRYARNISKALAILGGADIDQIIIEAFMENNEHETPFQFLEVLRNSAYSDIPVLVVAAEPSWIGSSMADCVELAMKAFGAQFVLVTCFNPDDANFAPAKLTGKAEMGS
jgi:hypothetical protein